MDIYSKYLKYKKKFLALKAGAALPEAPVQALVQAPIPVIVVVQEPPLYTNLNQYIGDRRSANIMAVVSLLQNEELYFFVCTAEVPGFVEFEGYVFEDIIKILIPIRKKYFEHEDMSNPDINLLKNKLVNNSEILLETTAFILYNGMAYAHQTGARVILGESTWKPSIGYIRDTNIIRCITTSPFDNTLLTLLEYIDAQIQNREDLINVLNGLLQHFGDEKLTLESLYPGSDHKWTNTKLKEEIVRVNLIIELNELLKQFGDVKLTLESLYPGSDQKWTNTMLKKEIVRVNLIIELNELLKQFGDEKLTLESLYPGSDHKWTSSELSEAIKKIGSRQESKY